LTTNALETNEAKDASILESYKEAKGATLEYIKFLLFPEYQKPV